MSGLVAGADKPRILPHINKTLTYTPYSTLWVPSSARCVCMGMYPRGTGIVQVYQLESGKVKLDTEFEKRSPFKCGSFGASSFQSRHLATGDFEGRLSLWDLENTTLPVFSVAAHKGIVNAMDAVGGLNVGKGAPEIATGGRDGRVCLWDPRTNVPVFEIGPSDAGGARDCWAVALGDAHSVSSRCLVAGYDNGDIKLVDLTAGKLSWEDNIKNGVCGLTFDRKDIPMNKLIVTALEGRYRVYDMRTMHPQKGYAHVAQTAHSSTIWCARALPQNREIHGTCGGNGTVNVWKYCYPPQRSRTAPDDENPEGIPGTLELLSQIEVSPQPIVQMDWHPDKEGLLAMPVLDQTFRVFIVTGLHKV